MSFGKQLIICCFQFDVDEFVASHLNDHRKGLLGRQLSAEALLTFSKVIRFTIVHFIIVFCYFLVIKFALKSTTIFS